MRCIMTNRNKLHKTIIASKILDDNPEIIGMIHDPVDVINNIIFIMEMTKCFSVQSFYNNVICYLKDRNSRDIYNKEKNENDETCVEIDFYFYYYAEYLKTFERLIKKEKFPLYPQDVYDIMYYWHDIKNYPERYIQINENGNIELPQLKII